MFKNIPFILNAQGLLDRAFRNAKKIQVQDRNALFKKKKTIISQTESFSKNIISTLEQYVKKFPSLERIPKFYQEIIDISIDTNKLKKSLGAVNWAGKTCKQIYVKQSKSLKKSKNLDFLQQKQQEIYGRISSVVKQIDKDLELLVKTQKFLKKLPDIRDIPTVVIAGYPNVGKSSLLKCLSSAKPKIAQYPFTTQEIHVGHIQKKERHLIKRIQIIDTPGLLDRPLNKRNKIEKQAIAAISHLADVIVFVLDPSETCGYSLDAQMNLLSQIKKMFSDANLIIVENKADVLKTKSKNIGLSCTAGDGIDLLLEKILNEEK
jgi:nucleolar GTP-binding protein